MAGMKRLGYLDGLGEAQAGVIDWEGQPVHVTPLGPPEFLPACGQGAVALETRVGDALARQRLEAINDGETFQRIVVERLILERLQAGCHTPVGVDSTMDAAGGMRVHLRVFDEDRLEDPPKEAVVQGSAGQSAESLVDELMQGLR